MNFTRNEKGFVWTTKLASFGYLQKTKKYFLATRGPYLTLYEKESPPKIRNLHLVGILTLLCKPFLALLYIVVSISYFVGRALYVIGKSFIITF